MLAYLVAAGVAVHALPEPYVPGSGGRVPAELRLVLAGYVGIAGGAFAITLAFSAALIFFGDDVNELFALALLACICLCILGFGPALEALDAGVRFSRLLRRPSDPRTAVTKVTAEHPFQLPATRTQRAAAVGAKVDRALAADQPTSWLAYEDRDLGHTAHPGVVAGYMDDRIQR